MTETGRWSLTDRVFRSLALALIALCLVAFYADGPMIGGVPLIVAAQGLAIPYYVWAAWRLWRLQRNSRHDQYGIDLMLAGWTMSVVAIVSTVLSP